MPRGDRTSRRGGIVGRTAILGRETFFSPRATGPKLDPNFPIINLAIALDALYNATRTHGTEGLTPPEATLPNGLGPRGPLARNRPGGFRLGEPNNGWNRTSDGAGEAPASRS